MQIDIMRGPPIFTRRLAARSILDWYLRRGEIRRLKPVTKNKKDHKNLENHIIIIIILNVEMNRSKQAENWFAFARVALLNASRVAPRQTLRH